MTEEEKAEVLKDAGVESAESEVELEVPNLEEVDAHAQESNS